MARKPRIDDADLMAITLNVAGIYPNIPYVLKRDNAEVPLSVDRLKKFLADRGEVIGKANAEKLKAAINDPKRSAGKAAASVKKSAEDYLKGAAGDNKGIWPTTVIDNLGSVMVPGVAAVLGLKVVSKKPRDYTSEELEKLKASGKKPRQGLVEKYEGGIVIKYRPDYIVIGRADNVGKKSPP